MLDRGDRILAGAYRRTLAPTRAAVARRWERAAARALKLFRPVGLSYRRVLGELRARDVEVVVADLAHFCYAVRTTAVSDLCCGRAELEGRRQVWLHLNQYLGLSDRRTREALVNVTDVGDEE